MSGDVLIDPLLDVLDLDLTGSDDGGGVSRVGGAEVEMVGTVFDDDGDDGGVQALGALDATASPGIELAVAKDDVGGGRDVEASIVSGDPSSTGNGTPDLLAVGTVISEVVRVRDEHVSLAVGGDGHDHLTAGLVGPSEVSEIRASAVAEVVAGTSLSGEVVEEVGDLRQSRHLRGRVGVGRHVRARHIHWPSGKGSQEVSRVRVVDHRHVGEGGDDPLVKGDDVVLVVEGSTETEGAGEGLTARGGGAEFGDLVEGLLDLRRAS
mmetsp:Transcript_26778/g.44806  ORF Transcript_26778/g.44806 Transcript_26778/m.44806 type:complete len:265 (+) Transcript_26778:73-867(+)